MMMCIEDTEVRKRNPGLTKEQVEAEFKRLYNVEKIIWIRLPLLEDDDFDRMGPLNTATACRTSAPASRPISTSWPLRGCEHRRVAEVTDDEAAESAIGAEQTTHRSRLRCALEGDGRPWQPVRHQAHARAYLHRLRLDRGSTRTTGRTRARDGDGRRLRRRHAGPAAPSIS